MVVCFIESKFRTMTTWQDKHPGRRLVNRIGTRGETGPDVNWPVYRDRAGGQVEETKWTLVASEQKKPVPLLCGNSRARRNRSCNNSWNREEKRRTDCGAAGDASGLRCGERLIGHGQTIFTAPARPSVINRTAALGRIEYQSPLLSPSCPWQAKP